MNVPQRRAALAMSCVVALLATSCSESPESTDTSDGGTTTTMVASQGADPSTGVGAEDVGAAPGATSPGAATTPAPVTESDPATPVSVIEVAEVGVPGLDSTDAFCAAWSRFAGSFQVVAVTAAFGSGQPEQLAALEVAASPVVTTSYGDLLANWPDELSSEAELVADEFLGPFARRIAIARESLDHVGADASVVAAIDDAWVAGLAQRDPSTPEFTIDLPDATWAVIDDAAADFAGRLVPFTQDPSLVTNVQTPLTSAYLAVSCPDQGTLSGQEVDAG